MDAAFFAAAIVRPRILGLRMRALKIGHARFLYEHHSPYFTHEGEPEFMDLIVAVFVCSHEDPGEARSDLTAWWFPLFLKLWSFTIRKANLITEQERFAEYLAGEQRMVELDPHKHRRSLSEPLTPGIHSLIVTLMQRLYQQLPVIDQMPIRFAQNLLATWGDREGVVHILSDRKRDFMAYAREQDRLRAEAKN